MRKLNDISGDNGSAFLSGENYEDDYIAFRAPDLSVVREGIIINAWVNGDMLYQPLRRDDDDRSVAWPNEFRWATIKKRDVLLHVPDLAKELPIEYLNTQSAGFHTIPLKAIRELTGLLEQKVDAAVPPEQFRVLKALTKIEAASYSVPWLLGDAQDMDELSYEDDTDRLDARDQFANELDVILRNRIQYNANALIHKGGWTQTVPGGDLTLDDARIHLDVSQTNGKIHELIYRVSLLSDELVTRSVIDFVRTPDDLFASTLHGIATCDLPATPAATLQAANPLPSDPVFITRKP